MKLKQAAGATFGLITFAGCIATATLAHYAEQWVVAYYVAFVFAIFAGLTASIATD